MKYYIWDLNEERKEIIFNKSENEMGEMTPLNEEEFNEYMRKYPDYKLLDLASVMINIFNASSDVFDDGNSGLVKNLMKGFH